MKQSFLKKMSHRIVPVSSLFLLLAQRSFAEGGTDILAGPAASLFATFKGTGVALLIVAEIIGAWSIYRKTGDMKAWIGLPILLVITGWAATKF